LAPSPIEEISEDPSASSPTRDPPAVAACAARRACSAGRSEVGTGTMISLPRTDGIPNNRGEAMERRSANPPSCSSQSLTMIRDHG
jgi:hypothetical protein